MSETCNECEAVGEDYYDDDGQLIWACLTCPFFNREEDYDD